MLSDVVTEFTYACMFGVVERVVLYLAAMRWRGSDHFFFPSKNYLTFALSHPLIYLPSYSTLSALSCLFYGAVNAHQFHR